MNSHEVITPASDVADYADADYWEQRYKAEENIKVGRKKQSPSREWLSQGYPELVQCLINDLCEHKIASDGLILILGCGTSALGADLVQKGYKNVVNSDISESCIRRQTEIHKDLHPKLRWQVLDMTKITDTFQPGTVDAVIEKATLDSILAAEKTQWNVSEETSSLLHQTLTEVSRALRPGGLFLSHTWAQAHFRLPFYAKTEFRWNVSMKTLSTTNGFHYYYYKMVKGEELDEEWVEKQLQTGNLSIKGDENATMSDDGDVDYFGNLQLSP